MKKILILCMLLILIVASVSVLATIKFSTFNSERGMATYKCNALGGKVIFFGNVQQVNDGTFHYESICYYTQIIKGKQTPSLRYELIF